MSASEPKRGPLGGLRAALPEEPAERDPLAPVLPPTGAGAPGAGGPVAVPDPAGDVTARATCPRFRGSCRRLAASTASWMPAYRDVSPLDTRLESREYGAAIVRMCHRMNSVSHGFPLISLAIAAN